MTTASTSYLMWHDTFGPAAATARRIQTLESDGVDCAPVRKLRTAFSCHGEKLHQNPRCGEDPDAPGRIVVLDVSEMLVRRSELCEACVDDVWPPAAGGMLTELEFRQRCAAAVAQAGRDLRNVDAAIALLAELVDIREKTRHFQLDDERESCIEAIRSVVEHWGGALMTAIQKTAATSDCAGAVAPRRALVFHRRNDWPPAMPLIRAAYALGDAAASRFVLEADCQVGEWMRYYDDAVTVVAVEEVCDLANTARLAAQLWRDDVDEPLADAHLAAKAALATI